MKFDRKHIATAGLGILCALAMGAAANGAATNGDEIAFRSIGVTSYVIHSYATVGSSTFTPPNTLGTVEYLVVGGGGSGATGNSANFPGGGGAGGLLTNVGGDATVLMEDTYDIYVGAGGASVDTTSAPWEGESGEDSSAFGNLTAAGGGAGGHNVGIDGGSGGGAKNALGGEATGVGIGHDGGASNHDRVGGGGGGAGTAGGDGFWDTVAETGTGGDGGAGLEVNITGTPQFFAAGGGGAVSTGTQGRGGSDIGGNAHNNGGFPGLDNTGSGGGGSRRASGAGGSGIVIVRYELEDVDNWRTNGFYALSGQVRRVLAEDAVALRIAQDETFSILADGVLHVGENAGLAVQGTLLLGAGAEVTHEDGVLTIAEGGTIGGSGIVHGGLTLSDGAKFEIVDPHAPLTVTGGTVSLGNLTVDRLILDPDALDIDETYTLITGATSFEWGSMAFGEHTAVDIGGGKSAYFQKGSLQLVVIPEPHTLGLLLAAGALLAMRRRGGR